MSYLGIAQKPGPLVSTSFHLHTCAQIKQFPPSGMLQLRESVKGEFSRSGVSGQEEGGIREAENLGKDSGMKVCVRPWRMSEIGRDEESKEGILGNQGALSLRPQLFPKHALYIAGFDFVVVVVLFYFIDPRVC